MTRILTTGRRSHVRGWALVLALGTALAGCGTGSAGTPVAPGTPRSGDAAAIEQARTAFDEVAAAFESSDPARLAKLSTGAAAAFFTHADHLARAAGGSSDEVFPNARAEAGGATLVDDGTVRFTGPLTWGTSDGPSPRVMTDLGFSGADDGWKLASFERNGFPIQRWVAGPPTEPTVRSGPISARTVGVFVDVTCLERADPGCPDFLADGLAVDFTVTNDSDGALEPTELELPDGTTSAAWLETPSGTPQPLRDAVLQGFPPGQTSPVTAMFGGPDNLVEGGTLHIALRTEDGEIHPVDLAVPAYPATW